MYHYEKWYSIKPIKGYVLNADFARIKTLLETELQGNINFIKERDYILITISSNKHIVINLHRVYNILKYGKLKKAYRINCIGNENTIYGIDNCIEKIKRIMGITH